MVSAGRVKFMKINIKKTIFNIVSLIAALMTIYQFIYDCNMHKKSTPPHYEHYKYIVMKTTDK